jgi:hypothetical protein
MGLDILKTLSSAASDGLANLTRDLYAGKITLAQWGISVAGVIKDAHVANGVFGAGGVRQVGVDGFLRIGGNLVDEFKHLFDFAMGIRAGDVSEAQALARIQLYGSASEQAYWREIGDAADRPEWGGLPELNQVPKDGGTQCLSNCNCQIRDAEDGLHWDLYPGESCDACEALAAGGPYRPGKL